MFKWSNVVSCMFGMLLGVGIIPAWSGSSIQSQLKADVGEYRDEEYAEMMQYYTLTPPDPVVVQAFEQLIVPPPEPEYDEEAMIEMYIYILGTIHFLRVSR